MAYSGDTTVLSFQSGGSLVLVGDAAVDLSAGSADNAVILIPIPFLIHQFGLFVQETAAAAITGDTLLQRSTFAAGTDITIATIAYDSTDHNSGDANNVPAITASTGSEAILIAGIIFGASSVFPYLVPAAKCLTVSTTQTAQIGEYTPFVVGNWLGFDFRSTETWASA